MLDMNKYTSRAASAQPECGLFSPDEWAIISTPEPAAPEPTAPLTRAQVIANGLRAWAERKAKPILRQMPPSDEALWDQRVRAFVNGTDDTHRRIERHFDEAAQRLAARRQAEVVWAEAALATIGTDEPMPEAPTAQFRMALPLADPSDCIIIEHKPARTPYDRARFGKQLPLQRKIAALEAKEPRTKIENDLLEKLRRDEIKIAEEVRRHANGETTAQELERCGIDEYRKTDEGRIKRNASRRTVRQEANADLSQMTDEQRAEHKREQARLRQQRRRQKAKEIAE